MQYRIREQKELKPSGVEWMGNIPNDLSLTRLKYLGKIKTGGKDTENKEENGEYPFFVRSDKIEKISTYSFDGEAVLTAGDGVGVGKVFHYINGKFDYHQRVYKVSDFKNLNGRYFYYYFKDNFHKEVLKLSAKSTVDSIRLPMLENFIITTPKVEIQQKIANFLDEKSKTFDDAISKKEELITKLQDAKQSLISEVVTGKLKVIQKDGKLQTIKREKEELINSNIDWLGDIPKDWQVTKFKYIKANEKNSFVDGPFGSDLKNEEYKNEGIPLIQLNNIKDSKHIFKKMNYISEEKYLSLKKHSILPNEIVIAKMAEPVARATKVSDRYKKYLIVADCIKFKPNKDFLIDYLIYAINDNYIKTQAEIVSTGTTRIRINLGELKKLKVLTCRISEQELIVSFLNIKCTSFDNTIEKTKQSIIKLKQAKESLISEAVTGKIEIL